jgi:hypothetical protein
MAQRGGSNELDLGLEDGASVGGEGVGDSFSNDDKDSPAIQEIVVLDRPDKGSKDCGEGGGKSLGLDPTNLFGIPRASATASTEASTSLASTSAASARGKRLSSESRAESTKKISSALTKPLWNVQKSPSNSSDADGEGDGWSFGNMMHMMMIQSRLDNERREQQNKHKADQREREYQLRREEMALARKQPELLDAAAGPAGATIATDKTTLPDAAAATAAATTAFDSL